MFFAPGKCGAHTIRIRIASVRMMKFLLVLVVIISGFVAHAPPGAAASPSLKQSDSVVVLISLDGLAGFYFDDPKAEMPTLRRLVAGGAFSGNMRASTPSVTWPNHTSIVTGMTAGTHGVTGNSFLDRGTNKSIALIGDAVYDKAEIVRVPTIYDLAHQAGLTTASIRWPATRNAATLDIQYGDMSDMALFEKTATPFLREECIAKGIWTETRPDKDGNPKPTVTDAMSVRVFNHIITKYRPGFALLHLIDVDHDQHQYGPRTPEAYKAIAKIDSEVAEVITHLERTYGGDFTVFIVSDHGFSPITSLILPNVILRDAGLVEVKGTQITGGSVRTVIQGGSTLVYITDAANRDAIASKVAEIFSAHEQIDRVVTTEQLATYGVGNPATDRQAPDMILFAKEGYAFGAIAAGVMTSLDKPETKGTHGHNPDLPHLRATFIAYGKGVRPGVELGDIANLDVAPTIARLMNLPLQNAEGKVLGAALSR